MCAVAQILSPFPFESPLRRLTSRTLWGSLPSLPRRFPDSTHALLMEDNSWHILSKLRFGYVQFHQFHVATL